MNGDFTLPGESGYETLTKDMAKLWGADVIRDSDGTKLSDELLGLGYGVYSTICLIRSDNDFAKNNMDKLQENFLMSFPVVADLDEVEIKLLDRYFKEQFMIDENNSPKEFWQVFDRTTGEEVDIDSWEYDSIRKLVTVKNAHKWHSYTVNFLAIRKWEEISMYNHITNDWGDKEHLMAVEPRYPEVQLNILNWLENWCIEHPDTTVVRFTSMFYNFAWFWGEDKKERSLYSDWGSYDFTANPVALRQFEREYGYKMTSEDFVNGGLYNQTHNPPTMKYMDWLRFTNRFVIDFGKRCIDLVHRYDKKAYVFYDDSWIGVEPYGKHFAEFGFDGLIKCVFNGFETRLCGEAKGIDVHEIRLHPYLFPTGLTGEPTFAPGGNPKLDAQRYWANVRRALLRKPVDRIGLGGYLHLIEPFEDFKQYMAQIADEFRIIKGFHGEGEPYTANLHVAVLTAWGSLRSWICSGHLHEHPEVDLTNILESLSGMPVKVSFISFTDIVENGIQEDIDVIINAGAAGSAWSGGVNWTNEILITRLTEWVSNGGGFIGINEPTAYVRNGHTFTLSHILGVDKGTATRICNGNYAYDICKEGILTDIEKDGAYVTPNKGIYALSKDTRVYKDEEGSIKLSANDFFEGRGVYLSGYRYSLENTAMLYKLLFYAADKEVDMYDYTCSNVYTECAFYPGNNKLVVINNTSEQQETEVYLSSGRKMFQILRPYETKIITV